MSKDGTYLDGGAEPEMRQAPDPGRREALRALSRFAAVTPPTVGLLLAAASRPVHAGIISECQRDDTVCDSTQD